MESLQTVLGAPLRRIYFVWGLVLIVGFILSGYGFGEGYIHWYPLILIGLASQIVKMRLVSWQSRTLLGLWGLVALAGTLHNQLFMQGTVIPLPFEVHFQYFWLILMSIPQFITGYLLKKKFQMALAAIWLITGVVMPSYTEDGFTSFLFVALITGLPYLYIAFKR